MKREKGKEIMFSVQGNMKKNMSSLDLHLGGSQKSKVIINNEGGRHALSTSRVN